MDSIESLRGEIDTVTSDILKLVAKRNAIAVRLGVEKRRDGDAIVDHFREAAVAENMVREAEHLGIRSTAGVLGLARGLFQCATYAQETDDGDNSGS